MISKTGSSFLSTLLFKGTLMNHNTLVIEIKSTLDKLIAARTSLGYDYIVYGLLLINEDQTRVSNITKAL